MKFSATATLLIIGGAVIMFSNFLQKPLGWPEGTGPTLSIVGAVLIWCGVSASRRAMKRGEVSLPPLTAAQYRKRLTLSLVAVIVASFTVPFLAPYTGVTLPFPQLVVCALVSCALCVAIVLFSMRRHRPRPNQAMQRTAR